MSKEKDIQDLLNSLEQEERFEFDDLPKGFFDQNEKKLKAIKGAKVRKLLPIWTSAAACLVLALWLIFPAGQSEPQEDWLYAYMEEEGFLYIDEYRLIEGLDEVEAEENIEVYFDIDTETITDILIPNNHE